MNVQNNSTGEAMPATPKRRTVKSWHPADDLSFTRKRTRAEWKDSKLSGRCWWAVQPSGDYTAECRLGRRMALEFLEYQCRPEASPCLTLIVMDMPRDLTGIEIGFLEMINIAATAGRQRATAVSNSWDSKEASE